MIAIPAYESSALLGSREANPSRSSPRGSEFLAQMTGGGAGQSGTLETGMRNNQPASADRVSVAKDQAKGISNAASTDRVPTADGAPISDQLPSDEADEEHDSSLLPHNHSGQAQLGVDPDSPPGPVFPIGDMRTDLKNMLPSGDDQDAEGHAGRHGPPTGDLHERAADSLGPRISRTDPGPSATEIVDSATPSKASAESSHQQGPRGYGASASSDLVGNPRMVALDDVGSQESKAEAGALKTDTTDAAEKPLTATGRGNQREAGQHGASAPNSRNQPTFATIMAGRGNSQPISGNTHDKTTQPDIARISASSASQAPLEDDPLTAAGIASTSDGGTGRGDPFALSVLSNGDVGSNARGGSPAQSPLRPAGSLSASGLATSHELQAYLRFDSDMTHLRFSPSELGAIDIAFRSGYSGLAIHVHADRPESGEMLRRHIGLLQQELMDSGVNDSGLSFSDGSKNNDASHNERHDISPRAVAETHGKPPAREDRAGTVPEQPLLTLSGGRLDMRL